MKTAAEIFKVSVRTCAKCGAGYVGGRNDCASCGSNIWKVPKEGQKHDSGKPDYSLLPPRALREVVKVLSYGASKYAPGNWAHVKNARERYYSAALRHLEAWRMGDKTDGESGLLHLAHATCCLVFLLGFEVGDA